MIFVQEETPADADQRGGEESKKNKVFEDDDYTDQNKTYQRVRNYSFVRT